MYLVAIHQRWVFFGLLSHELEAVPVATTDGPPPPRDVLKYIHILDFTLADSAAQVTANGGNNLCRSAWRQTLIKLIDWLNRASEPQISQQLQCRICWECRPAVNVLLHRPVVHSLCCSVCQSPSIGVYVWQIGVMPPQHLALAGAPTK